MRENWRAFRDDPPGQRFRGHYQRLHRGTMALRVLGVLGGLVLVAGGVALLFLPGPGLLLLVFGFALFGGESKILSRWLDRGELRARRAWGRLKSWWQRR